MWLESTCCTGVESVSLFPMSMSSYELGGWPPLDITTTLANSVDLASLRAIAGFTVGCPVRSSALQAFNLERGPALLDKVAYNFGCHLLPGVQGASQDGATPCFDLPDTGDSVGPLKEAVVRCPSGTALAAFRFERCRFSAASFRVAFECRQSAALGAAEQLATKMVNEREVWWKELTKPSVRRRGLQAGLRAAGVPPGVRVQREGVGLRVPLQHRGAPARHHRARRHGGAQPGQPADDQACRLGRRMCTSGRECTVRRLWR